MRFYGGSVSEWAAVPVGPFYDFLELAGRLRAEERLAFLVDAQLSSGYAKSADVRRHARLLERMASGGKRRSGDSLKDLAAIGIRVERVKAAGDA